MAERKYQVFISSTFADLKEERRKILDVLLMADCIPAGMEAFVASDAEQFEVIKKVIDLCDYYILIIGKRYGSINAQTGLSYTEMEYNYAISQKIPVFVFAIDESVAVPESKADTDLQRVAALKSFRQKALGNRLGAIWKTADDLIGMVSVSITRAIKETPRPGWQRTPNYSEASLHCVIIELKQERNKLAAELDKAQKQIQALSMPSDLAYETCTINIKYREYLDGNNYHYAQSTRKLPEIFRIISTEMMGVSLNEFAISKTLLSYLFPKETYRYSFTDPQLLKLILNQLEALNLLYTYYDQTTTSVIWGLTEKGKCERNRMILVYNS